jgi:NAD(P)H dehydrogenase (quinone)
VIAVLGGTGTIGKHVSAALAGHGVSARALTREPDRAGLPLPVVAADLRDPASLRKGIDGAEQLFLLTPHGTDQQLFETRAVDAAVDAGVRRIVKVSGSASSLGPNGASSTAVTHWRSERRIEDSGLEFCFLRPSFLMQNLLTMPIKLGLLPAPMGHAPIAMIDARDVAACAVAALLDEKSSGHGWHLTGPAPVTFKEAARKLGARYVNVPARLAANALRRQGASSFEVDHAVRMAAYFATGADGAPTDAVVDLTGRQPRPLDEFLSDQKGS